MNDQNQEPGGAWSQKMTPQVCDRTWRTSTPALPAAANSGQ